MSTAKRWLLAVSNAPAVQDLGGFGWEKAILDIGLATMARRMSREAWASNSSIVRPYWSTTRSIVFGGRDGAARCQAIGRSSGPCLHIVGRLSRRKRDVVESR